MVTKKKQNKKGINFMWLIPVFLALIGILLFKISSLTGDSIIAPCPGGSTLIKFHISGLMANGMMDGSDNMLSGTQIKLQPIGKNCMYSGKTNKQGYAEFARMVRGEYKLTIMQKDINRGKSLCDSYKETLAINSDAEYNIMMTNCNSHAFTVWK